MKNLQQIIISFLVIFSITAYGQLDTLNKFNSKKKKIGYWKQFIDQKGRPTDSINAYFYRIELYDDGKQVFKYYSVKWEAKMKCTYSGNMPPKGKPIPINGTLKWYDEQGHVESEQTYSNGSAFCFKSYIYSDKKNPNTSTFSEVLYFDRKYNNTPGSYYAEEYGANGKLEKKYWFRKGLKGWSVDRVEE
jgi:hypothetical protein